MDNSPLVQFRALMARQQLLQQQHQNRIARRIHDDINQKLTFLSLQLSMAALDSKSPPAWAEKCKRWSSIVMELGQSLRDITTELQPRIRDDAGLPAALQWFVQVCPKGLCCRLSLPEQPVVLPPFAANELLAICADIVTDLFAPGGVSEASISLEQAEGLVRLRVCAVEKNGRESALAVESVDALCLHERLWCIDGSASVAREPGKGFVVTLTMPDNCQAVRHAA
ncbi:MAG: histidine kinase [Verrucomicrobiota bacterium]|jgi:signal transduction histidine kinase